MNPLYFFLHLIFQNSFFFTQIHVYGTIHLLETNGYNPQAQENTRNKKANGASQVQSALIKYIQKKICTKNVSKKCNTLLTEENVRRNSFNTSEVKYFEV